MAEDDALAPTTTQLVRARGVVAELEEVDRLPAIQDIASMLAEIDARVAYTPEAALAIVARNMPPLGQPNNPSAVVKGIIKEVLVLYRRPAQNPQTQASLQPLGQITVTTAEEQAKATRSITIAGYKFPAKAEEPYTVIYLHLWFPIIKTEGTVIAFEKFSRQLSAFLPVNNVHDCFVNRYRKALEAIQEIFRLLPTNELEGPEKLPISWLRLWYATFDSLLELFLLCLPVRLFPGGGTHQQVTAKFSSLITGAWMSGEIIDYYKMLDAAKEFKPAKSDHPLFRGGHGKPK